MSAAAHTDDAYHFPRRELQRGDVVRIGDRRGRKAIVLHVYSDGSAVIKWRPSPNGAVAVGRFTAGQVVRE